VGRLITEKGVFDLLDAYSRLEPELRSTVGLVFVGDGKVRTALQGRASTVNPGSVHFAGFAQREELAVYYALAEAFVFPTHSDPWGLVVNEAMACGLPIVISSVAGCAADLVVEGWNGYVLPAHDIGGLARAMESLALNPDLRNRMGHNSTRRIQSYSPELCASGLAKVTTLVGMGPA